MKVRLSVQVYDYISSLPPEPKRRVREGLRGLVKLSGDIKELQHPLDGYCRLRINQFRIIFKIGPEVVDCIFIERRPVVYEVFEQVMLE